jgi:hypothetical protein
MRPPEAEALAVRVRSFIRGESEEGFGEIALAVGAYQRANSPVIAALSDGAPLTWRDLPAVPVELFKRVAVGTVPVGEGRVFRTSGTTGGPRGEHRTWTPELYELGAERWARACVEDLPPRAHALLLDAWAHPDSSLSHMVALLTDEAEWYLRPDGVDLDGLERALAAETEPVFVPCTGFALAEWFERGTPAAPPGSVVMVTGGFKGRVQRVDDVGLYATARAAFTGCRVVTEYGMTELSSQLWGEPGGDYAPPAWLRALAVDPVTGTPLPAGRPGQLRFVDLCNLDSAVAIETLDAGVVHEDGTVTLHGRLAGSGARGCSLTVEEAWARRVR